MTARWFRVCIDETDIKEKKIAANQHTAFDFAAKRTDKESKKDGKENEEGQKGFIRNERYIEHGAFLRHRKIYMQQDRETERLKKEKEKNEWYCIALHCIWFR